MSKPSLLRFLRQWFLILTVAVTAIACGGRSDEGLLTPEAGSDATLSDARDGGLIVLPDGAVILPDGALTDITIPRPDVSTDGPGTLPDGATIDQGGTGPGADGGRLPDGGTTAMLQRITVDPPTATLGIATTQALTVTGVWSDGTTSTLTQGLTFNSNSTATATVTQTAGLVTAVAAGMATITVTRQPEMLTASSLITVSSATVMSIAVTPTTQTIGVGGSVTYVATATMSDGSHQDVTNSVVWSSSDATVASISTMPTTPPGIAKGLAAGMTTIKATMMVGGVSGTATLTVTASPLVSIAITPPNPILPIGVNFTFKATATYANGMTGDVTNSVVWTSGTPTVGTIGAATGMGSTLAAGTSVITASLTDGTGMTISGTTTLTVTAAKLVSITVTPAMSTVIVGLKQQLTATGRFDNNTNLDITASVAWSSSNASSAFVSTAAGTAGQVSALAAGMATITATMSGISGTATVTVVEAKLVSIAISPAMPSVPLGATIPMTASGTYDNGLMADVTTLVTWSTDAAATATISNAQGTNGQVVGRAIGMTNVHAVSGAISASVPLVVTAAVPTSIEITPANPSVQITRTQQMIATAVYSDGTRVDVTTLAAWTTGRAATATISNGAGTQGVVTAVAVGTTTITATWSGLMATTNITVTPAIPTGITVTPFEVTILTNGTQNYTAVVIYDIGTQATVTAQCMWTSSNTSVATIALGGGGPGGMTATARGLGGGDTTITCTYTAQGVTVTGTATLHVRPPVIPMSINITPDPQSCTVGGTGAFVATAVWSDGTSTTVTNTATWTTADATIAGISTTGATRGVATCIKTGTTTVTVTFNNGGVTVTGTATLNVTGTPTGVTVSANALSLVVGQNQAYTTAVLFSDGTSRQIAANSTEMVCLSSDPTIATIQVAGNARTGACLAVGMVTYTCTYTPTGSTTSVNGTTTLDCQDQIPTSISIAPTTATLSLGAGINFTATAIFPGTTNPQDITQNATTTWSSSNAAIVTITTTGTKGRATSVAEGTAVITVDFRGVTATATVTVGPLAPVNLTITPNTTSLSSSTSATYQYYALLNMSDGTSPDVTANCNWTLTSTADGGAPGITISNTGATKGLVTVVANGTPVGTRLTLTATYTGTAGTVPPVTLNITVTN